MEKQGRSDCSALACSTKSLGGPNSSFGNLHRNKPGAAPNPATPMLRLEVRALLAARDINVWPFEIQ